MKFKKPGLRIIKTLIAVALSMLISYYRPGDGLPFSSAIAAIICLQPDPEDTLDIGKNRFYGTILGGVCGLVYLLIVPANFFSKPVSLIVISIMVSIIIWIMAMMGKPKAIVITSIVFLSITVNQGNEVGLPYYFAFNTTFDTMVGVIVAILVNRPNLKHGGNNSETYIVDK